MKTSSSILLLGVALAGCRHDADTPTPGTDTLVGTWRLTARQCYCTPGLPNEVVTFAADSTFQYYHDGALAYSGSYSTGHGQPCARQPTQPLLSLHGTRTNIVYAPGGNYVLTPNTLVVDGGSACLADAPVYTYRRQ